jgi:hypothetical protein
VEPERRKLSRKIQHRHGIDCCSGCIDLGWSPTARADDKQTISDLEHKYAVTTGPGEVMKFYESGGDVVPYDPMPPEPKCPPHYWRRGNAPNASLR